MSWSLRPGMIGATLTPTEIPARASVSMTRSRRAGVGTYGSMARAFSGSQNGMLTVTCDAATRAELGEQVDVALDQRRLGDDGRRVLPLDADLETAARQPVRRLQRLVAVGDAAEDDGLAPPALLGERRAQQRRRVRLDDDLAVEVGPGAEAQVLVRRARVAVSAGVKAAAVGVHAPGEADVGAVVLRQDVARAVDEDLEPHLGRPLEVLHLGGRPGVRRIGDRHRAHLDHLGLNVGSVKSAPPSRQAWRHSSGCASVPSRPVDQVVSRDFCHGWPPR